MKKGSLSAVGVFYYLGPDSHIWFPVPRILEVLSCSAESRGKVKLNNRVTQDSCGGKNFKMTHHKMAERQTLKRKPLGELVE